MAHVSDLARLPARRVVAMLRQAAFQRFHFWERHGLHVLPVHYYSPLPDTRALREELWSQSSELVGIDMRDDDQIQLLEGFHRDFQHEYDAIPFHKSADELTFYLDNDYFRTIDAEILYCMIRRYKPKRVFEIGSGMTTLLSARALLENEREGTRGSLIAFEPYPNDSLRTGFSGLDELRVCQVQDVPIVEFNQLEAGDILFIDSTHALKIGGDVEYEFLEILPRLHDGVLVHIHDIFIPREYPREWILRRNWFPNEQYLLQAFLAFNEKFRVVWAGHYMHLKYPELLRACFRHYSPEVLPGSFWIRRAN